MMRPGDERVLLTLYLDDSVRATYATAAMQTDHTRDLAVMGEHDPYGVPLLTARHVLDGDTRHRAVIALGHTTKDTMKYSKTSADRHAFNALYGFTCDCDDCATPKQKAFKQELARHLRAAPKEAV